MTQLTIKPVENETEYLASRRLTAQIFSPTDDNFEQRVQRSRINLTWPGFDYSWHRVGTVDGEIVTHVSVWPHELRYGSTTFTFGAIGGVCTHPDHRGKGYASEVMQDAIRYMKARGDDFSLLVTGARGFYSPLGYHNVWPEYYFAFGAADAAALESPLKVRPARPGDLAQMAALYERQWQHRVARLRTQQLWQWHMNTLSLRFFYVVEDRDQNIVGYAGGNDETAADFEIVVETPAAAQTLLAKIGQMCLNAGHNRVELSLPPDDMLLHYAPRWLHCERRSEYEPKAGWMGKVINYAGFRDRILKEMLAVSIMDERGLIFDIQPDTVYLGLRGQDTTNIQLDHGQFLRVLFGTTPPAALGLHPDAAQLLNALFPPRVACLARWDWF